MKKQLQTKKNKDVQKKQNNEIQLMHPFSPTWPFVSFRYSSRTMYCDGEKTHVKALEKKFENGRFDSKEFEGTMEKGVYDGMIQEMQQAFFKQMDIFFKPLSLFLSKPDKKRD